MARLLTDLAIPVADKLLQGAKSSDVGLFVPEAFIWRGTLVSAAQFASQPETAEGALRESASAQHLTVNLPISISA